MSKKYLIHVDTASVANVTSSFDGYSSQPCVTKTDNNPFQSTIILGNRHRNIRSISLKNAQIPVGFYNIRVPYNTFELSQAGGLSNVSFTVTPGNYNIVNLLNSVNSLITTTIGAFSVSSLTNSITFVSNQGVTQFFVGRPSLLYFLGFTNFQQGVSIQATSSYITNWDSYLNIWIENLGQSSLEPGQITFKIPLNVGSAGIEFWAEGSQHEQKVVVTDRGVRLDRLNIKVMDRFGNPLDNNGIDWSFTLEIEADT